MSSVQSFSFEPERNEKDGKKDATEDISQDLHLNEDVRRCEEARVGHNLWCLCGNCESMPTKSESVCCKELCFLSAAVHGKHIN